MKEDNIDEEESNSVEEKEDKELMSKFELAQGKGRFVLEKKESFKGGKLKSCEYHPLTSMIVLGFKSGTYALYRLEEQSELKEI